MNSSQIVVRTITDHPYLLKEFRYFIEFINRFLPYLGANSYLEEIEDGFIGFFENFEDIKLIYANPPDKLKFKAITKEIVKKKSKVEPIVWRLEFISIPDSNSQMEIFEFLAEYFRCYNARPRMAQKEDGTKTYEFRYDDAQLFHQGQKYMMETLTNRLKKIHGTKHILP
jgi:hypothetical protein